jgi:hypothetical protein
MELLIAAGIAALGYKLSRGEPDGPVSATPRQQHMTPAYREEQLLLDAKTEEERAAANMTELAKDPKRSGVVLQQQLVQHRLQPFFRSARGQNTSDGMKNRLHDLFTGSTLFDTSETGTYKHKVEAPNLFQPVAQAVTSSGSAGNPVCLDRQMPVPSMVQNNVLPTEQIRVGPGVGIGAEVSAADGFHPQLRIMPQNVNEYRINQLETRINIGSSMNSMRPVDPNHVVNRPPRIYDINRRPPEREMASVTARTHRPEVGLRCVDDRYHGDEYFGNPRHPGHAVSDQSAFENTRIRGDQNAGLPLTNVTGARSGTGGFTHASFDSHRLDSQQREQSGTEGMLTGNYRRETAPTGHVAPQTLRGIASTNGYIGGAGHNVPSGATRLATGARTTLRETTAGPDDNGPVAPIHKAPMVQCTYQHLEKEAKRPHAQGYFAAPERNTEFRRANIGDPDPWELAGICKGKWIALKERDNENRQLSHAASHRMYINMAPPGASANGKNKLPEVNARQDFGLAQVVLKDNAYHVPMA